MEEYDQIRLINIIYAKHLYAKSKVIIDFGTATTIDVLDKHGVYDGGVITPGIDLSLKSLQMGTAKLPLVNFKKIRITTMFYCFENVVRLFVIMTTNYPFITNK